MPQTVTLNAVEIFVVLVATAAAAALVVRRFELPYTVVLLILGLAAGALTTGVDLRVPPELILTVFLPALVFEGGYRLDLALLRRVAAPVVLLAVLGVVACAGLVAVVLNLATGLPIDLGFVVGAMLAATDPPAVLETIKRLKAPHLLGTAIEAESLFNDGTAIVLFGAALTAVGGRLDIGSTGIAIVVTILASGAIGILGGLVASRLIGRIDDHLLELTISLILAYGTYLVADQLHQSGVIATVVAAIVFGNYGRTWGMSERTQEAIDTVWEFGAFLLTAMLFLVIGLAISVHELLDAVVPIGWGIAGVLAARALFVYGITGGASRLMRGPVTNRGLPLGWLHIMMAAGMRGAVAVALALSLPADVPQRQLLVDIVFGVTLFTLIAQGLLMDVIVTRSLGHHHRTAGSVAST